LVIEKKSAGFANLRAIFSHADLADPADNMWFFN